ncbi:MAG: ribonuclease HII [Lachnospiraceae bacterium]|nr:ribonuclease HII [Lachnospiraceae bacterium]
MGRTKQERLELDAARVRSMRTFEDETAVRALFGEDASPSILQEETVYICGVDEAGRGPLAGPVAAAAVILPPEHTIPFLNDSKKLSAAKRDELFDVIREEALAYAVALVDAERIDKINILQATYEAMRSAIAQLPVSPSVILADAVTIPGITIPQVPIVKGDAKCLSIAAASILAKVTRDRLMEEYDAQYPGYGFAAHKGYGTAAHIEALKAQGPSPIHRRTFLTHFL